MPALTEFLKMDWHPSPHIITHYHATLLESDIRSNETISLPLQSCTRGAHILLNIEDLQSASLKITLQGYFASSEVWYDLLSSDLYETAGSKLLKIHPEINSSTNKASSDFLPAIWRVVITPSDSQDNIYSVETNMVV